ncbi:hypothetical protein [Nocardioides psychrotolerans]|uniref:hypothetical protein n=1 Tax=Nocardioides psychrotolerans TaxID=1005945 RepID=UPI00313796C7
MTQPPQPPYGGQQPYVAPPPPPRRRRPSGWWFALGGAMVVGAIVAFIGLLVWTLTGFMDVDARITADDTPQSVVVDTESDVLLWADPSAPDLDCVVVDTSTGSEVRGRSPGGSFTRSLDGREWEGVARYDAGSGRLEVTCPAALGEVEVGPAPAIGSFVGGIFATILVPLVLGGLGLVVLIVTGVLFATGRPRREA